MRWLFAGEAVAAGYSVAELIEGGYAAKAIGGVLSGKLYERAADEVVMPLIAPKTAEVADGVRCAACTPSDLGCPAFTRCEKHFLFTEREKDTNESCRRRGKSGATSKQSNKGSRVRSPL